MDQGRRTCKKCHRDFWLAMFREYAPGKRRHTCRECENARQTEYQRAYEQRKREKTVEKSAQIAQIAQSDTERRLAKLENAVEQLTLALQQLRAYNPTNS